MIPDRRLRGVYPRQPLAILATLILLVSACGSRDSVTDANADAETNTIAVAEAGDGDDSGVESQADDAFGSNFAEGALLEDVEIVDCTLESGSDTHCYRLLASSQPEGLAVTGPFCPTSLTDEHGMFTWDGENPGLYALDEAFWAMLSDQGYEFVNADGSVNVADPGDVSGPVDGDTCLQASPDASFTLQVLLPVTPEDLEAATSLDTVAQIGVAVDGATIFGDAPFGTSGAIPALDPCGGHNDPSGYYHWHFGADSVQLNLDAEGVDLTCGHEQDSEHLVGFAFDGYAIYGPSEGEVAPMGLDECAGHVSDTHEFGSTYHYHLSEDSPNLPPCRVGATAVGKLTSPDNPNAALPDGGGPPGAGRPRSRG